MELDLTRPICFFDLETTGTDICKDRIVEISVVKIFPNGNRESRTWLVNQEEVVRAYVSAIDGSTNERVANEPTFKEHAPGVCDMIKHRGLGGYNWDRCHIPLLAEAVLGAGFDF